MPRNPKPPRKRRTANRHSRSSEANVAMRISRRELLILTGSGALLASGSRAGSARGLQTLKTGNTYDVAVIGAGVFGAWTARHLQLTGKRVILVDAYGPSNSRASSGGESRVIRMSYGQDEIYTRFAMRALALWKEFFQQTGENLFHRTGVLQPANADDTIITASLAVLQRLGVKTERLTREAMQQRFPQLAPGKAVWALYEPESGVLMARRAVQAVVSETVRAGARYVQGAVVTPEGHGELSSLKTREGTTLRAQSYVFACGPWLPKVFPDLLGHRIFPTRQEVYFFGTPAGDPQFQSPAFPTWICRADEMYGMPDIENRGVKIAYDYHGPPIDPDRAERAVTPEFLSRVREYLGDLVPALRDAPLVESRVCQYENTSNGDFLIDRHPDFTNVWLVGGGSGHGFKHGPAVGEYVAQRLRGAGGVEPRFSLATKSTVQHRAVF